VVKGGKVHKVPATPKEALASNLMGMFEKRRFRNFLIYMNDYEAGNPATHKGYDLKTMTAQVCIRLRLRRCFLFLFRLRTQKRDLPCAPVLFSQAVHL
jgi:RAB protein geranylgeranyltransferase component A